MIEEKEKLKDELKNNEIFKRGVTNILSHATPYVPYIGLACGAICIGKHVMEKRASDVNKEEEEKQN